jgi:Flp pilus assembly protein TadG
MGRFRGRCGEVHAARDDRGSIIVLFAFMLPLLLSIGSIVVSVGNWYVHQRHLQTQVDAAAFAAGTKFTGCFADSAAANTAIRGAALAYAGDTNRDPTAANVQVQEPQDVHVVMNSERYWHPGDPSDDATLSATLDNTITYPGDLAPPPVDPSDPCETRFLDVKATDESVPDLWPWLQFSPDVKTHARIQINKVKAISGMLPFAVPEADPGAVAVILTDEDAVDGMEVLAATKLSENLDPAESISKFNAYDGLVGPVEISSRDNISVVVLVSQPTNPDPDLSGPSIAIICSRPGVRCHAAGSKQGGLALIHGYSTGSMLPALKQVDVSGCNDDVNLSGPYFSRTGECLITVSADIDFGGASNPQLRLYNSPTCNGSGEPMAQDGTIWSATTTLPDPSASTGQVPFTIAWKAGTGGFTCFDGGTVARPYVANSDSGPVDYLSLQAYDKDGNSLPNGYSVPKEPTIQPLKFVVTVGLRPPLVQSSLDNEAVLIRFASEDNPSQTQSIDCDVDSYKYPAPYDTLPADVAEIAYGCVSPYSINPTLDCSEWSNGELPPDPPPELTEAPDCAESKQGQVTALQKGLSARLESPCTPNHWPDPPITPEKVQALADNFGSDPRLVSLIVTEFGAFAGTGGTIIPIKYFAGFYVTGWDYSQNETPGCPDPDGAGPLTGNDPHPLYGTAYQQNKPHLDDGDVWGYFVTAVTPAPAGSASEELCAFDELGTCIAVLVE